MTRDPIDLQLLCEHLCAFVTLSILNRCQFLPAPHQFIGDLATRVDAPPPPSPNRRPDLAFTSAFGCVEHLVVDGLQRGLGVEFRTEFECRGDAGSD
jgi:hypothetical protein